MAAKILLRSAPANPSAGMRPYCIVLRDLGERAQMRYVTHRMGLDALGGFSTGHYWDNQGEATHDFIQRCDRDRCPRPAGVQL